MLDFEPDRESVSRAAELSSRLIQDLRMVSEQGPLVEMRRELWSERRYDEQAHGVPIVDVITNVGQMATEFAMARRWDYKVLCLKLDDGELAPIAMTELLSGPLWPLSTGSEDWFELWEREFPFPFPQRVWREILRRLGQQDDQVIAIDVREVEGGVERSLTGFLSYRFAGMKKHAEYRRSPPGLRWVRRIRNRLFGGSEQSSSGRRRRSGPPPPEISPGGGLHVEVSCLTPGLRLHVSPAYFINWVFFGSPTTPVSSYVLPGRYVFAGDGPMMPKRTRDHGVFSIPPTYRPHLTRF